MKRMLRWIAPISMMAVLMLSWSGIIYAIYTAGDIDQRYRFLGLACGAISSVCLLATVITGRPSSWYLSMGIQMFVVIVPYAVWTDASLLMVCAVFLVQIASALWGGQLRPALGTISDPGFDAATERVITRSWVLAWLRNSALLLSALFTGLLMIVLMSFVSEGGTPLLLVALLSVVAAASMYYLASVEQ